MLKERQDKILLLMKDYGNWYTGKEIAKYMNVTDRTIRSDIEVINTYYKVTLIESHKRYGYRMNHNAYLHLDFEKHHQIPQISQERCAYIIRDLLFQREKLNLLDIQNELYVSDYSIDMDIKKIKRQLKRYNGLKLLRSKNCIYLEGTEKEKRVLYKDMLKAETQENFLNLDKLASFYHDFDLLKAKDILEEVLHKYSYTMQEMAFPMLILHIGISIQRILQHNFVQEGSQKEEVRNTIEYNIAKDFYHELAKLIRIEVIDSEIILLTFLLMGKKAIVYTSDHIRNHNDSYSLDTLVKELIQHVVECFDIDLSNDRILEEGLQAHIISLLERNHVDMQIPNVYLHEIKRKYPLVFEMGIRVGKFIEDKLHIILNEDEIGFIAMHLGSAYERNSGNRKYRAVLIYPQDQAFSHICMQKINSRFQDRMEIEASLSFFEMSSIKELKPDLILTTLPLRHNLEIITVQISMFVNYEDESDIFQAISQLDKKRFFNEFATKISHLIEQQFFYVDLAYNNPQDVIEYLCNQLKKAGYTDDKCKESILQREKMSSTSFIYNFAIPHSLNVPSIRSNISVAILKEAIPWGEYEVKLVLLLAINAEDNKMIRMFFDWLSGIVGKSEQFNRLLLAKNAAEFVNLILDEGEVE